MSARLLLVVAASIGFACRVDGSVEVARPAALQSASWIANVSVFDGKEMLRGRDVLIRGSRIESVTSTGASSMPAGAVKIDGTGKTLLPGLIDAHAHFSEGFAPWSSARPNEAAVAQAFAYAGVTTVLVAQHDPSLAELEAEARAAKAAWPHLYLAGPGVTAAGGHPIPLLEALIVWPVSAMLTRPVLEVTDKESAREGMRALKSEHRLELVKIFFDDLPPGTPRLGTEGLQWVLEAARAENMRPIVHTALAADMVTAAQSGAALLMHTPFRDRVSDAQAAQIAATKVPFVTTARIWTAIGSVRDGKPRKLEEEMIAKQTLASFTARPEGYDPGLFAYLEKDGVDYDKYSRENVVRLIRAGVPFFTGTDTGVMGSFPGAALHGEMALLAELGISPLEILRAATSAPAAWLDPRGDFGTIAPGKRADLLLVRGDPSVDITAIDAIEEVFLAGDRLLRKRVAAP